MDFFYSVLSFVVAIGVLVTVHEFGHFWVARRLGVKVLRFSVGFGRPLFGWRAGPDRTEYVIAAVPLGGYVKMLDEREGDVDPGEAARAFNRQTLGVRAAVVLAGPVFNFLFAVLAYWAMFVIGVAGLKPLVDEVTPGSLAATAGIEADDELVAVAGRRTGTWEAVIQGVMAEALHAQEVTVEVQPPGGAREVLKLPLDGVVLDDLTRGQFFKTLGFEPRRPRVPPLIGYLEANSPAEKAGLAAGDLILAADGESMTDWRAWVDYVRSRPDKVIRLEVEREGARRTLSLRPEPVVSDGRTIGRIGAAVQRPQDIESALYITERYGPLAALGQSMTRTYDVTFLTLRMFWKMVLMEISVENLSGPISIAQYAGSSAQIGISRFLQFLAIVSISLGILNLLPIPVLDGGHLMYYCIELFMGRPLSDEAQMIGQRLGIAMLVGLMGLAFYNDLARLFG